MVRLFDVKNEISHPVIAHCNTTDDFSLNFFYGVSRWVLFKVWLKCPKLREQVSVGVIIRMKITIWSYIKKITWKFIVDYVTLKMPGELTGISKLFECRCWASSHTTSEWRSFSLKTTDMTKIRNWVYIWQIEHKMSTNGNYAQKLNSTFWRYIHVHA
jgi:hypothetical protein